MAPKPQVFSEPRLGRYIIVGQIAAGGMATVHLGRLLGAAGFERTVAIKRMHPQLAKDPQFASSFVDEARLAACIRHPNVASTLDVIVQDDEILVVMDYVQGESLSRLLRQHGRAAPPPIVLSIVSQMLSGLHAAHEATSPRGEPLHLVHRDVSPHNVVVGTDGIVRVVDFGVAKASWRMQDTRDGSLKGKLSYMSPEQLQWRKLDRRSDIFSASVVLWEALTGERLFTGESTEDAVRKILLMDVPPPSTQAPQVPKALDAIVARGLARDPTDRFETAHDMAVALDAVTPHATVREVGAWVSEIAKTALAERTQMLRELEKMTVDGAREAVPPQLLRALRRAEASGERTDPGGEGAEAPIPVELVHEGTNSALSGPVPSASGPRVWHRQRGVLAAGLALVVIAVVAGLIRHRGHAAAVEPPLPAPPATAPSASATAEAPVEAPPSVSARVVPIVGSSAPAPPADASARKRPGGPALAPARAPKPPGCDPPYTVGPDGIRRFRAECI
jgi:hypothetical protein